MHVKSNRLAPSTLQRYEGLFAVYLRPAFGTMPVGSLRTTDLTTTYGRWSKRKSGARTVRHASDLLRNVLNRAVKWNLILRNPAQLLDADDLPRLRKPASAVLSEVELSRLLEEARHPTQRSRKRGYPLSLSRVPSGRRVCGVYWCAAWGDPSGPLARRRSQRGHRHDRTLAHGRTTWAVFVQGTQEREAAHDLPLRATRRGPSLASCRPGG